MLKSFLYILIGHHMIYTQCIASKNRGLPPRIRNETRRDSGWSVSRPTLTGNVIVPALKYIRWSVRILSKGKWLPELDARYSVGC